MTEKIMPKLDSTSESIDRSELRISWGYTRCTRCKSIFTLSCVVRDEGVSARCFDCDLRWGNRFENIRTCRVCGVQPALFDNFICFDCSDAAENTFAKMQ